MENHTAKKLATVIAFVSLLAVPALAERHPRPAEPREAAIVRITKIAKRILGISTTGDFPTPPNPSPKP